MTTKTAQKNETAATAASTSAVAPTKITTFKGAENFIRTSINDQNDVDIVSLTVEDVDAKVDDTRVRGQRIRLELSGAGIEDPTRRYFLRNNSRFASSLEDVGLHMHAPKKERNTTTYIMFIGMTENVVSYEPPAPAKAEKVLLTAEQRKERRLAGKQAKRLERAAAAAQAAESGESAPAVEAAKSVEVPADTKESVEA